MNQGLKTCGVLAALMLVGAPAPASAQSILSWLKIFTLDNGSTTLKSQAVTAADPLPVTGTFSAGVVDASSTDASGTVTLGGTYQLAIATSATRKGCLIQNNHATEALSVRVGTTTVYTIAAAGGTFQCSAGSGVVVTDNIYVTATTTSHAFAANFQ